MTETNQLTVQDMITTDERLLVAQSKALDMIFNALFKGKEGGVPNQEVSTGLSSVEESKEKEGGRECLTCNYS
jgi:hypothetical protein